MSADETLNITVEQEIAKVREINAKLKAEKQAAIAKAAEIAEQLAIYQKAEAEAKAAAEKAEAEAKMEKLIQERVAAELANRDSLGTFSTEAVVEDTVEESAETERTDEDLNKSKYSEIAKRTAATLRI